MTHYLVTGGAGFIGSHVVETLLKRGKRVKILDNFFTGKRENLEAIRSGVELIEGDVRDSAICREVMEGVDAVIHLAALHEVVRSVECPMETHEVNVTGTLNLLVAARGEGVKKFVFASSSAVYGENSVIPRSERLLPSPTSSPYAVSKLAGEHYCQMFWSLYGLDTVCLRFFNVYGPRQDAASTYAAVIPKFISLLLAETAPTIYGDGEQSRDFTFIADCVSAVLSACEVPGLSGMVFNVGTGHRTTVNQLCAILQKVLHTDLPPTYAPPQLGDLPHDQADIEQAKRVLSYRPQYDLARGLQETINHMRLAQNLAKSRV
ncbi:MAG TPA: SDR family oxidoreductase [Nitrospirales bacterium]|nr:SDR family oxidoreductase [Nitrospirales bacterium]